MANLYNDRSLHGGSMGVRKRTADHVHGFADVAIALFDVNVSKVRTIDKHIITFIRAQK